MGALAASVASASASASAAVVVAVVVVVVVSSGDPVVFRFFFLGAGGLGHMPSFWDTSRFSKPSPGPAETRG